MSLIIPSVFAFPRLLLSRDEQRYIKVRMGKRVKSSYFYFPRISFSYILLHQSSFIHLSRRLADEGRFVLVPDGDLDCPNIIVLKMS